MKILTEEVAVGNTYDLKNGTAIKIVSMYWRKGAATGGERDRILTMRNLNPKGTEKILEETNLSHFRRLMFADYHMTEEQHNEQD